MIFYINRDSSNKNLNDEKESYFMNCTLIVGSS